MKAKKKVIKKVETTLVWVKCNRCGYEWVKRIETPNHCPGCNSPYWNKLRQRIRVKGQEQLFKQTSIRQEKRVSV